MAEIVKETQFKVIKLTVKELQEVEGGYALGICDWCGEASFDGYYIAVLNRYYCPKCYEEWLKRAKYYPEDKPREDKNFNCWKTALERIGVLK